MFKKLFGKRRIEPTKVNPQPLGELLGYPHLFIDLRQELLASAIDDWNWLHLKGLTAHCATAFGDVVLTDEQGAIYIVDMLEGQRVRAANSLDEFANEISSEEKRDEILFEGLVMAATASGLSLAPDQCFDFKIPPILGGEVSLESVEVADFTVKSGILGQVHEQVKDLPPGTPIGEIKIG